MLSNRFVPATVLSLSEFKAGLTRQFNRGSTTYDQHADLQNLMGKRLLERLSGIPVRFHNILELGCGTGGLTAGLIQAFPEAHVTAVDLAAGMVELARTRLDGFSGVRLCVADAEIPEWGPAVFDLIISSATLQWFEHPGSSVPDLVTSLRRGGHMLHSTFGPRTFSELHSVLGEVEFDRGYPVPESYGLPLLSAESWKQLLSDSGLTEVRVEVALVRRTYAGLVDLLLAVKGIGAAFAPGKVSGGALTLGSLREVARRYDERFAVPGGVLVTYELIEMSGTR